jgi:hypothetical protein
MAQLSKCGDKLIENMMPDPKLALDTVGMASKEFQYPSIAGEC